MGPKAKAALILLLLAFFAKIVHYVSQLQIKKLLFEFVEKYLKEGQERGEPEAEKPQFSKTQLLALEFSRIRRDRKTRTPSFTQVRAFNESVLFHHGG